MNGWNYLGSIITAGLIMVAMACGTPAPKEPGGEGDGPELRTYTVPTGYDGVSIKNYLRGSFDSGETKLGTVLTYPDGILVVTAPPRIHAGIRQLFAELEERGPRPQSLGTTVALRYWILIARSAAGPGESVRFASAALRDAGSLRPVLDELAETQGPLEFSLLEQISLASLDQGDRAQTRGRQFVVEQRVLRPDAGSPIADISIQSFGQRGNTHAVETRVRLESGKYVVLGQTAYNAASEGLPEGWNLSDEPLLFYVISSEDA